MQYQSEQDRQTVAEQHDPAEPKLGSAQPDTDPLDGQLGPTGDVAVERVALERRPVEVMPVEGIPAETQAVDYMTAQARPSDVRPVDVFPAELR